MKVYKFCNCMIIIKSDLKNFISVHLFDTFYSKEFLDLKSTQGITHQLDFIRIKTFALKGCYEEDGKKKKAIDKRKYFQTTSDKELVSQLNSLENNPLGQKI